MKLTLTGADIADTISRATEIGISVYDFEYLDILSAKMWIWRSDWPRFWQLAEKKGDIVNLREEVGLVCYIRKCRKRIILMLFSALLIMMTMWIPGRILFISVQGNERVSTEKILQQAEMCGIYFGANRKLLRSEKTKNMLAERLPELSWVGVNTYGCNALIQVRERNAETKEKVIGQTSSIVAIHDGIITDLTVTAGDAQCSVGEAVKKGQVLISGFQDLGTVVKLVRSKGEIYARTKREICVIAPRLRFTNEADSDAKLRLGVLIGKNRINLSNFSGISYAGCDKIYKEYSIVLPGGFILPLSLTYEYFIPKNTVSLEVMPLEETVLDYADSYVLKQLVSGRISQKVCTENLGDNFRKYTVVFDCVEMIGRERTEAYRFDYGENN